MEYISTSALANEHNIQSTELFETFKNFGWLEKKNEKWVLTEIGKQKGGKVKVSPKFGEYVVWPDDISFYNERQQISVKPKFLNATAIAKDYKVSSQRLNLILSELGWIEKGLSGWAITNLGKTIGGRQFEHETSGGYYVLWPTSILSNKSLNEVFREPTVEKDEMRSSQTTNTQDGEYSANLNFRDKFEAKHRTQDGHLVRSRGEMLIDNLLYQYGVVHAYERKLPIDEDVYSDFYLPTGKVYIEYWGMETDEKYSDRKKKKIEIYKKHEISLIELTNDDILNLDDYLPKKLLKHGIKVY